MSEEKLLRATFDYATLDIFVETDIPGMGNALVKVLDCDSITQALFIHFNLMIHLNVSGKEKMHRSQISSSAIFEEAWPE